MKKQKNLETIMFETFRNIFKKFIPVFWIPVLGDRLLDIIFNPKSSFCRHLLAAYSMMSLM